MKNNFRTHPADLPILTGAALLLAAASGWAAWQLSAQILPTIGAVLVSSLFATLSIWSAVASGEQLALQSFEPEAFGDSADEDPLLLDDPLTPVSDHSRVVRLFDSSGAIPGELVVRISDFLDERSGPARVVGEAGMVDASEALHAALANIRASLR